MRYRVVFTRHVQNELEKLKKADRDRIVVEFIHLRRNPYYGKELEGKYRGLRLVKVGKIKVIYEVYKKQLVVLVVKMGSQRDLDRFSWLEHLI